MVRIVHRAPARAGSWFRRKSCDELISIASQKANSQISSEVRKWVCGWEMKVCSPFLLFYRRIASQKAKWRWSIFLFFAKRLYTIHKKNGGEKKRLETHRYTSRNTFLRLHSRLVWWALFSENASIIIVFVVFAITLSIVYGALFCENHRFCSFCDYIIDCVFLKLRTKNEDDSKSGS